MYYFIVNETGGSGSVRRGWRKIRQSILCKNISYRVYRTAGKGSATRIAGRICTFKDDDKRIVVVGGDGTLNEVLNGIMDFSDVAVGIIPLGSGNDFATGVGISKDPDTALNAILSCEYPRRLDLGRVTYASGKSKIFGISAGIGMDAMVCHRVEMSVLKPFFNKLGIGRLIYIFTTITTLFSMKKIPISVSIDKRKPLIINKCVFLAAMNMPIEGGGVPMAPNAVCDDRRLSMCVAHSVNAVSILPAFASLLLGRSECRREFFIRNFKEIEVNTLEPIILHTDGEYGGSVQQIKIKTLPGRLRFLG